MMLSLPIRFERKWILVAMQMLPVNLFRVKDMSMGLILQISGYIKGMETSLLSRRVDLELHCLKLYKPSLLKQKFKYLVLVSFFNLAVALLYVRSFLEIVKGNIVCCLCLENYRGCLSKYCLAVCCLHFF